MRQINIYVEGKGDMVFLTYYLCKKFSLNFSTDFTKLKCTCTHGTINVNIMSFDYGNGQGGINSKRITELIATIIKTDLPIGIESVIIIDADTSDHNDPKGGFSQREGYLRNLLKDSPIKYFLMPNHKDDGNLETLLDGVVSESGANFYSCLKNYINCLMGLSGYIPAGIRELNNFNKTKLEWYTYIMLRKTHSKANKERDYSDVDLWDLETDNLLPLKLFFDPILSGE